MEKRKRSSNTIRSTDSDKNSLKSRRTKYDSALIREFQMKNQPNTDPFNEKCDTILATLTDVGEHLNTRFDDCSLSDFALKKEHTESELHEVLILDDAFDQNSLNEEEAVAKMPGIVIQIVKEEGNLKMKQVTSGPRHDRPEHSNDFPEHSDDFPEGSDNFPERTRSFSKGGETVGSDNCEYIPDFDSLAEESPPSAEDMFLCCICDSWKKTLTELLDHIKYKHKQIRILQEYERLLYQQKNTILKVETSSKELILKKNFKAVEKLLESSKRSLTNFTLDLFGKGDINIFEKFISVMFKRIEFSLGRLKKTDTTEKTVKPKGRRKKALRCKRKKKLQPGIEMVNVESPSENSGFSSEDDVCLKSIREIGTYRVAKDGEIIGNLDPSLESEWCLQFYTLPVLEDSQKLSLAELESIRVAIKNICDGKLPNFEEISHVKVKRVEWETDEALPPDTLFCGNIAKENTRALNRITSLAELFNAEGDLIDELILHDDDDEAVADVKLDYGHTNATFACEICGDEFATEEEKQTHDELHKTSFVKIGADMYVCQYCNVDCVKGSEILLHYATKHKYTMQCEVCSDFFASFQARAEHFKTHRTLACGACGNRFKTAFLLREHFHSTHRGRSAVGKENNVSIHRTEQKIKSVIKFSKTSAQAPNCKVCGRKFTSFGRLSQHLFMMHGETLNKK